MPTSVYIEDFEAVFRIPSKADLDRLLKQCCIKQPRTPPKGTYYARHDFVLAFGVADAGVFYRFLRSQEQPMGTMLIVKEGKTNSRSYVWSKEQVLTTFRKATKPSAQGTGGKQEMFRELQDMFATYLPVEKRPWVH